MLVWGVLCAVLCVTLAQIEPGIDPGTASPNKEPEVKDISYWVTFSGQLIPGQNLEFRVAILKGTAPVLVTISLLNNEGNKTILSMSEPVSPGAPSTISLVIPFNVERPSTNKYITSYTVKVRGTGSEVNFEETSKVNLKDQALTVFVQTDKAIYKPGQKVQYRIMALTPDLKAVNSPMDIFVKDPKQNRIWQERGVTDPSGFGVIERSLQLASRVPEGEWKVEVHVEGQVEEKTFDVKQYLLPKFEVQVDTPSFGLSTDTILPITVKATYTFGEPVTDGNVKVEVKVPYSNSRVLEYPMRRGQLNSRGEFSVKIPTQELLSYLRAINKYNTDLNYRRFDIIASVSETNTWRVQTADPVSVTYYPTPLELNFLAISPSNFKSGLGYTGYLEVTKRDKTSLSPVELSRLLVRVNITYEIPLPEPPTTTAPSTTTPLPKTLTGSTESVMTIADELPPFGGRGMIFPPLYRQTETKILDVITEVPPSTGWITLNFPVPENASSVNLDATVIGYEKWNNAYKRLGQASSPTDSFLQLLIPPKKVRVGEILSVTAKSTDVMTDLHIQLYSKSLLVHSETIKLTTPGMETTFDLALTQAMTPSLKIVAFYIREDNSEFVVDALSLNVGGIFAKNVSVEFSRAKVKPGDTVDVKVKAEQGSRVYLLSNDKSVLLLKKGNDLTQEMVQTALVTYDYGYWQPWMRYMVICGWPSYYGGTDASQTFNSANVKVMTDGLVYVKPYEQRPWLYRNFAVPLAMASPMADAPAEAAGAADQSPDRVRKLFPENWLWISELITNPTNELSIPSTAPDTITTWVTTVFSMHPVYGLSVGAEPAELTTFLDLFVSLDLPLSITKDEEYCFTASLFSYYPNPIQATITLQRSDNYESIYLRRRGNTVTKRKSKGHYSYLKGLVRENDIESVMYCFVPTTVGKVPVTVTVKTNVTGLNDAVERVINVKADGTPRATTRSFLVDLSNGLWSQDVDLSFLNETVPGSQYITVSTAGNLMGPILENLDDLLRKPYGCGEQNMLNFAPNIFLLEFYFKTGLIDEKKLETAKEYMLIGYAKEILYEHGTTGGYSTFGNSDNTEKPPSLWLTAFVTKCFAQAEQLNSYQEVLRIDLDLISRSILWMATQQNRNGSFTERGTVFNKRMQGGSAAGEALTAYTLIAFHEALQVFEASGTHPDTVTKIRSSLAKGTEYLETELTKITDVYDICIVTYVLHLLNSNSKTIAYNTMNRLATTGDGYQYWKRPDTRPTNEYWWSNPNDAIAVEATAYALLTYALVGQEQNVGLPALRWLSNQRGPNGGFYSTQDTVIGLQALTSVSANMYSTEDVPLTLSVTYTDALGQVMTESKTVNKETQLLLQKIYVPYKDNYPKALSLTGQTISRQNARTAVLAEVVMEYNVETTTEAPSYLLRHKLYPESTGFQLNVFISTTSPEPASMTILEMDIPPGFAPDTAELMTHSKISDVEILEDRLVIYFDTDAIDQRGVNVDITLEFTKGVLISSKPKFIRVYNYYEPNDEVTVTFDLGSEENICSKAKSFSICPYV